VPRVKWGNHTRVQVDKMAKLIFALVFSKAYASRDIGELVRFIEKLKELVGSAA